MTKEDRCYVRVSTKYDSQKDSPEHQEAFIKETAARENITITKVYADRDTATSIVEREDVRQMISDAQKGQIRSLWFASLSRFSRDALDAITLKRVLVNALKIRVVSIEDGYDSAKKDDELLFGIKSVVNQNTSGDISISSRRGIRQSILDKGNIIASKAAFGYRKVKVDGRKTYEVIPEQAAIVVLIYDLYIDEGLGDKSIVKYLNGDNPQKIVYPSYKGELWSLSTVQSILQNPTYTGYNVAGRYSSEIVYDDIMDLMNRRKKLVKNPPSKWEWSKEITHPVIIPKERYDLAQAVRTSKGGRGGRRSFVNVFAKMMFCAECGSAMVTMTSTGRGGKKYRYLMCSRRRRMGESGCKNNHWLPYQEARDELISNIILRLSAALETIEKQGSDYIGISAPANNFDKEKRKLNKRIEDNRKLLFEIRRQHMLGEIDSSQYEFEKEQYEKEIADHEKRLQVILTEEQRVMDYQRVIQGTKNVLKEISDLTSYDDVERTRSILNRAVRGIRVTKEGTMNVETYV